MRSPAALPSTVVVPIASARRRRLAHVSHELRGALTAADLALSKLERHAGQEARQIAAAVRAQLERAALAVDEFDTVRGAPTANSTGPVGPDGAEHIVRRRVEAWSRIAPDGRTIALHYRAPGFGGTAGRKLVPALDNLIANALEHGIGAIDVDVSQGPGRVVITVADEGLGIPAATSRRSPMPGRGLGLDIARRAAFECGGRLVTEPDRPPRLELPIGARVS